MLSIITQRKKIKTYTSLLFSKDYFLGTNLGLLFHRFCKPALNTLVINLERTTKQECQRRNDCNDGSKLNGITKLKSFAFALNTALGVEAFSEHPKNFKYFIFREFYNVLPGKMMISTN